MVKTTLVEQDIDEGRRLLEALKSPSVLTVGRRRIADLPASHFRVKAAYWLYLPESKEWRLFIATPLVDERGPQAAYLDLRAALVATSPSLLNISLENISVVTPKDPFVKALLSVMKSSPVSTDLRLTRSSLDGKYVEDAYIYRLR